MFGQVRVGTCSWTDPTMVRAWYPSTIRTAADRLRHYATQFDTVEVDSTFYGLPTPDTARLWAERTPAGFIFHVKAFAMLTRHAVRPQQLPPPLRSHPQLELDRQGRVFRPSPELRREVFALFTEALEPLRVEHKMGLVLLQYPPYFVANEANREYIASCVELLSPDRVGVEFRHASWVSEEKIQSTFDLLHSLGASYVSVDEPRLEGPSVLPPIAAATSDIAYVRLHGRNSATWRAKVDSAAKRFEYLYSLEELTEWVEPIRQLQEQTTTTYVMFNNCFADYAPRNAKQMLRLLEAGEVPAGGRDTTRSEE